VTAVGEPAVAERERTDDLEMVARGGSLNFIGAVANGLFQFALVVVVTRALTRNESGAFFEAIALFLILSNTAECGADTGLTRMIPSYRVSGRTCLVDRCDDDLVLTPVHPYRHRRPVRHRLGLDQPEVGRRGPGVAGRRADDESAAGTGGEQRGPGAQQPAAAVEQRGQDSIGQLVRERRGSHRRTLLRLAPAPVTLPPGSGP